MQPRTINDLSEVPADERDRYIPTDEGTFKMHPVLAEQIDQYEAEIEKRTARIERTEAQLMDTLARREIRKALLAAGVNETFTPVITAMMRERMNFRLEETEDDFRVAVADAYGEVGIEFAVNTWLATEGAAPYRPTPKPTDGPLMARLRQLRATMH